MTSLIVYGNPADGFSFVGPFPDGGSAVEYASDDGERDWWVADLSEPAPPPGTCIRVRSRGQTEDITYGEFVRSTIQDDDVAREIAERMLSLPPGDEYPDNEGEPEFYVTYQVLDADVLRFELEAAA